MMTTNHVPPTRPPTSRRQRATTSRANSLLLCCVAGLLLSSVGCSQHQHLIRAIDADHRSTETRARDQYRHPKATLAFFEVEPTMHVVEIWPGRGWYTEVLAPYLRGRGKLYAAHFPADSRSEFFRQTRQNYKAKLNSDPVYSQVTVTSLLPPFDTVIAPKGSADRVLTFRNVHNWAKAGKAKAYFQTFYDALKPGGILGVVEHRAKPGTPLQTMIESGYMTEAHTIGLAQSVGFKLVGRSDINANPNDSADHPAGVWTLPPTLRINPSRHAHYRSIGESDRMTLKFIKPTP